MSMAANDSDKAVRLHSALWHLRDCLASILLARIGGEDYLTLPYSITNP